MRDGSYQGWAVRYTYSAEGDLVRVSDSARGTTVYHVDAAHRLVGETTPDGRALAYELDEANNVVAKPGLSRLELTSGNRLVGSDRERFEYDERDQLVMRRGHDGSVTRYTYDSFDMLVRLERWAPDGTPEPTFEYSHDALGRRLSVRAGAYARELYWDGDRIGAEVFPNGRLRIYTYAGREALVPIGFTEYESRDAAPESGRAYFVYSDPVGMPLHIEDAAGEIVWWASRIDPYGLIEVHPSSQLEYNLRWPGHYYDPETGLHSNRYRVYDPVLGRYLQSDPLGYEGSDVNLYAYCDNPLIHVDVLGLSHPHDTDGAPGARRTGEVGSDGAEGTARPDLPTTTRQAAATNRKASKATRPTITTGMETPDGTQTSAGSYRGPREGFTGLDDTPQTKAAYDRAAAEVRPPVGASPEQVAAFPQPHQSGKCGEAANIANHERATGEMPPPGTQFHSVTTGNDSDKPACPYCSHVLDEQGYTSSSGTSAYSTASGTDVPARPGVGAPPAAPPSAGGHGTPSGGSSGESGGT